MISKLSSHLGPTSLFSGVSAPSLVLYLDAGNTFSYTGTGSTWYDLTNLNNDILLSNTTFNATYSNLSKFKGSFEFNGSNSGGALISGTAIPIMDSHYTIESWFQANTYDIAEDGGIIGWGNYNTSNEVNALRQSGGGFKNYWWGSDLQAIPGITPSVEYWYHVAATYDGTTRTIYLNGQSIGSDTPGVSHSVPYFNNLTVGVTNASEFFNGRLGMIKVWNKNLNSSQILTAFNSSRSKYGYDFGSMTFNDTQSAYLISSSTDYAFGTNDFTIEAFFKATATASYSYAGIVSLRGNGTYSNGIDINLQYVDPATPLIEFSANSNFLTYTASNDDWYHVAISRTGGTSSFFVNGTLFTQVADQSSYANNDLVVGRYYTNLNDYYFNGVISNVRVINGTGLYTSAFSIPSVQLSGTVSNTKFLITSQEVNPSKDMTGLHSVTASNIGWTSSLPTFITSDIYFDLGNPACYPGTGGTITDLVTGTLSGALSGGLNYSSNDGGYLDFTGGQYIDFPSYDFGNEFTVIAWIKPSSKFSIHTLMANTYANGNSPGFKLEWNEWNTTNLKMLIEFGDGSSGNTVTTTDNIIVNDVWQQVVYTFDKNTNTIKFYKNATQYSSSGPMMSGVPTNGGWYIGSMVNGSYGMYARLGIFEVYKSILSDSDITKNWNNNKSRYGL